MGRFQNKRVPHVWYTGAMEILGRDFGFPLVAKLAILRHHETYRIPWHRHDTPELQYVLSGALTYEFRRGTPKTLTGGCLFVVPAGVEHRAVDDAGAPSTRLGLQFNPPTPSRAGHTPFTPAELADAFATFSAHSSTPQRWTDEGGRAARGLFRTLESSSSLTPDVCLRLRHLVNAILIETVSAFNGPATLAGGDVVVKVMDWIRDHCTEPLRISDLVRISGYSRTRLFALFAAEAGLSPNDFLLRCRVERAKGLLRTGSAPLTQVALDCGFSSSSYFSTVFRKYVGCTPRDWRTTS